MAEKKATKLEQEQRIATVIMWFTEGLFDVQIVSRIMEVYDLSTAAAYKLLEKAYSRIHEKNLEDVEQLRKEAVERTQAVYRESKADKDYNAALKAEAHIAKLVGTYAPEKREEKSTVEVVQLLGGDSAKDPVPRKDTEPKK